MPTSHYSCVDQTTKAMATLPQHRNATNRKESNSGKNAAITSPLKEAKSLENKLPMFSLMTMHR